MNKVQNLLDARAQISTGSYVGTGTYGQSNPTMINCGFKPKYLYVWTDGNIPDMYYVSKNGGTFEQKSGGLPVAYNSIPTDDAYAITSGIGPLMFGTEGKLPFFQVLLFIITIMYIILLQKKQFSIMRQ